MQTPRDMLGRAGAVSVDEALSAILAAVAGRVTRAESVEIDRAFGRVLAEDVISPEDHPPFARSTMDGYAVRGADTFGATETTPAYLDKAGEIPMGEAPAMALMPGQAVRIATGGMLPEGADAVLMHEYATEAGAMVEAQRAVAPGENVIARAEDVRVGQAVLARGRRLRPDDVAVMASLGITSLSVYARPRVAVISTGDEIVPPGATVKPGQIRDSNSYTLRGMIRADHADALLMGIVPDDESALREAVERAVKEADMVLMTGGSSVGARDNAERVIAGMGRVLFHSVTIKPGKPLLAGAIDGVPVFGLPGHPRAVYVCYEVFVRPALQAISGEARSQLSGLAGTVTAHLTRNVHAGGGRQEVIPVAIEERGGELWATPLIGKSGVLSSMLRADGTLVVPAGRLGHAAGDEVRIVLRS